MSSATSLTAIADFFAMLSLGLLALIASPEQPVVVHSVESVSADAFLLSISSKSINYWHQGGWVRDKGKLGGDLQNRLIISCNDKTECLELFKASKPERGEIFIALPHTNKQAAKEAFYEKCAVQGICKDLVITHSKTLVDIKPKTL